MLQIWSSSILSFYDRRATDLQLFQIGLSFTPATRMLAIVHASGCHGIKKMYALLPIQMLHTKFGQDQLRSKCKEEEMFTYLAAQTTVT